MAKYICFSPFYGIEADGEQLPEASGNIELEQMIGCIAAPITVYPDIVRDELDNKRVKTNTTIPNWLKRIAEENHVNYSHILETALKEYLGLEKFGK
ncbi:MAG: hypothetical protein KH452_07415 [Clostridiales bacterium]|nr:hypothetical protein [Clostridiales bacterium]